MATVPCPCPRSPSPPETVDEPLVLKLWCKLEPKPFGKRLFSWIICRKAPYFASIKPRILSLAPGRGEATLAHRRRVTNHIGTMHAIALWVSLRKG